MQKQKIFVENTIIIDIFNVKLATLAFQSTKIMFDIKYALICIETNMYTSLEPYWIHL